MKKILFLAVLAPSISFAQRIEIAEQAGLSLYTLDFTPGTQKAFSNHLSVAYKVNKLLSLGAFYEYQAWKATNNTYGITTDLNFNHVYAGIDLAAASVKPMGTVDVVWMENYSRSYGFGAHLGAKQKLYKQLSLIEQAGINFLYLNVESYSIKEGVFYGGPVFLSHEPPYTQHELMPYCRIGVCYSL